MYVPRVFVISNLSAALDRAAVVMSGAPVVGAAVEGDAAHDAPAEGGPAAGDPVAGGPVAGDPAAGGAAPQWRARRSSTRYDVRSFGSVKAACQRIPGEEPDAAVLLLRDRTPEQCLQACIQLQEVLSPRGIPLAVIYPSTDPCVWQRIYASGANMFLPWHGEVIEGLPTYVGALLSSWGRAKPDAAQPDSGRWRPGPADRAHARRQTPSGRIVLDERRRCAHIKNWHADFTPIQFRILRYLVANRGRLVSKAELASVLMETHKLQPTQVATSLYQHISQIRKKLGPHAGIVRCIRSRGYLLDTSFLAA